MVTNIDLTSPEIAEKKTISGKSALIFSVSLLAAVFIAFILISFMKSRYSAEDKAVMDQIRQEQEKISGATFAEVFDFQGRLDLVDKAIDDHAYWDILTKKMSGYILPEVKLKKFSGKKDPSGAGQIDITGVAPNLDALSRQLILLKDLPNLDSLEFKNAGENTMQAGEGGGVSFDASLKINKSAFQK